MTTPEDVAARHRALRDGQAVITGLIAAAGLPSVVKMVDGYLDTIIELETECNDQRAKRDGLFDAIKHGDDAHRAWLKAAITAHFAGESVPPYTAALSAPATREEPNG